MESWVKASMGSQSHLFTGKSEDWLVHAHRIKSSALGIKGLLEVKNFLNMASSEPEQDESYTVVNARFFLVVSNSIDPRAMGPTRIVMQFTDSQDGRGAFKALEAAYKPNTTFNKLQLHAKLADPVREANEDITAYSLRLVNLRDELRIKENNKEVWPDMQLLEALLRGLRGDGTFATTIEIINTTEDITLERATQLLRQAEERGRYRTGAKALFTTPSTAAFKGSCYYCGKPGHKSRDCKKRKHHAANDPRRQANNSGRDGKPRGDPKQQAGAGSSGKYCPVHPMAKHDAGECKVLKQHPHLATALAAVAPQQEAGGAAGEQELPSIRPFGLVVATATAAEVEPAALAAAAGSMPIDMVVDSGATHHYFDPLQLKWDFGFALTDIVPYTKKVSTGGGSRSAVCMGTVHLRLTAADGSPVSLALTNSIVVPLLGHHLLSVRALKSSNILPDFGEMVLRACAGGGGRGSEIPFFEGEDGLYHVRASGMEGTPGASRQALITAAEQALLWHERLGHINWQDLKGLAATPGTGVLLSAEADLPPCASCPLGKSKHSAHPSRARQGMDRFELLHSDWAGPITPLSIHGNRYPNIFVDDSSNYAWIYCCADHPTERVIEHLNTLSASVGVKHGLHLKGLRFDCAKEFMSKALVQYCTRAGIELSYSSPYSPQENGVAERRWQTTFNTARAWMHEVGAPKELWEEAVMAAIYTSNRVPSSALGGATPYEVWHGRVPELAHMRKWGCHAFVHAEEGTKLAARAWRGLLVGYGQRPGEYRVYNPATGTVFVTRHVTFVEHKPSSFNLNSNFTFGEAESASAASNTHPAFDGDDFDNVPELVDSDEEDRSPPPAAPTPPPAAHPGAGAPASQQGAGAAGSAPPGEAAAGDGGAAGDGCAAGAAAGAGAGAARLAPRVPGWKRPQAPSTHTMGTRVRASSQPPPAANMAAAAVAAIAAAPPVQLSHACAATAVLAQAYATVAGGVPADPQSYKEAMGSPEAGEWRAAMQQEYDALTRMGCWELVEAPSNATVVGSRWVFKSKLDAHGIVARRKARFVARGFTQRVGEHYDQTFSPVVHGVTLRTVLALAAQHGWLVHQVDFNNAFINAPIDGTIYVQQPEGFESAAGGAPLVLLLKRSLYGLAQSPRLWCKEVSEQLAELGYVASPVDPCVFVHMRSGVVLLLYVDDLLLTGTGNSTVITAAVAELARRFSVKNLGAVQWFLGMSVSVEPGCVVVHQDAYVRILLERFGMLNCNGSATPAAVGAGGEEGEQLATSEALRYRSLVGGLLYVAVNTRPDIAHTVMSLARHVQAPARAHWQRALKVLRYLKSNTGGLVFTQRSSATLDAFADASFATDSATGRSTTGFVLLLCGAAVAWRSKLQSCVAQSTTEAEYISLALTAAEVNWLRQLLAFLNNEQAAPTPIYEDNSAALQLASNPVVQQRTRTINVKYHYLRQLVGQKVVDVLAVRTGAQRADILTKALPRATHKVHAAFLLGHA
jgi:transposase InsO family protein